MEQKEIYELISQFSRSSLCSLEIEEDFFRIKMEKGGRQAEAPAAVFDSAGAGSGEQAYDLKGQEPLPTTGAKGGPLAPAKESASYEAVKAPIVGIYYAAPSPGEAPYVTVGQKVEKGQVLCLIEAMKMMNELKSPISGIVRTAHGINGELVEYDQILFEVESC